jgi:hypothetical protein
VRVISKQWLKKIQPKVWQGKSLLSLLIFLMGMVSACSLEKELPGVCVSSDKALVKDLCRDYKSKGDEASKILALIDHGFNERDAKAMYLHDEAESVSCKRLISKQCDLVELRNGVGY